MHHLYQHFTYPQQNITETKDWSTTDYLGIGLNHNLKKYIYNVLLILPHLVLTSTIHRTLIALINVFSWRGERKEQLFLYTTQNVEVQLHVFLTLT